ncbi:MULTISPECIES: type II toxin-antitoxin system HicA family toxin [Pyramidobacter]|uniref:type II toxin-antitoxin system HicA family toxin n=1 Tax=Pyramidobacter TaxID=638847 RepID=UPI001FCAEAAE|nr:MULTISPECIES: type II toxin-antitoxin system HicA family toxin [Pyramidobacter]WOL39599.1 type II toxin-antitoxin system HicA family toxin [Pyramidobacter sp. YE332]BDF78374.1 toxin HicA [Pyramidobacter piscolens]
MPKTPLEMEKIIMRDGWYWDRTRGSHRQYKHPIKKGVVTIAFHTKELTKGTENSILKQAGLK